MAGTWSPVGLPINVGGIWYRPPFLAVNATLNASGVWLRPEQVGANPLTGAAAWTTGDVIPAMATTELTALAGIGRATQIG